MSDLIDRQATIKAIQDLYPTMPRINFGDNISNWQQKYRQYIECENAIRILPSAEPDKTYEQSTEKGDMGR